jgi:CRP/FNR family transcriptional regulator
VHTSLPDMLSANPVFAHLDASEQALLAGQGTLRSFEKAEILSLYGDVWPYLMLVVEGEIDAIKESGEGRRLLVSTFLPGDVFWGLAFFHDDAPMPVTLEARRPGKVVLWPRQRLLPLILENGHMGWELCRILSMRMLRASEIVEELAFQPVAGRLAHFLIDLAPEASGAPVARSFTLDEVAARIGSTREVVCRFLQRFADQGLIEITRSEFVIVERELLSSLAQQVKG